jgi:hypothetical protein
MAIPVIRPRLAEYQRASVTWMAIRARIEAKPETAASA